jgi:hypothetical protein
MGKKIKGERGRDKEGEERRAGQDKEKGKKYGRHYKRWGGRGNEKK